MTNTARLAPMRFHVDGWDPTYGSSVENAEGLDNSVGGSSASVVLDVETVIGSTSEGEANGLGRMGMWLRPRIAGLGRVNWHAE